MSADILFGDGLAGMAVLDQGYENRPADSVAQSGPENEAGKIKPGKIRADKYSGQHLDSAGYAVVQPYIADGRGHQPDKKHLTDGVTPGSKEPCQFSHEPACENRADQGKPPAVADQGFGYFFQR